MKNTKKLNDLKGQRFVTSLENKSSQAIKGGTVSAAQVLYLLYKGVKAMV